MRELYLGSPIFIATSGTSFLTWLVSLRKDPAHGIRWYRINPTLLTKPAKWFPSKIRPQEINAKFYSLLHSVHAGGWNTLGFAHLPSIGFLSSNHQPISGYITMNQPSPYFLPWCTPPIWLQASSISFFCHLALASWRLFHVDSLWPWFIMWQWHGDTKCVCVGLKGEGTMVVVVLLVMMLIMMKMKIEDHDDGGEEE